MRKISYFYSPQSCSVLRTFRISFRNIQISNWNMTIRCTGPSVTKVIARGGTCFGVEKSAPPWTLAKSFKILIHPSFSFSYSVGVSYFRVFHPCVFIYRLVIKIVFISQYLQVAEKFKNIKGWFFFVKWLSYNYINITKGGQFLRQIFWRIIEYRMFHYRFG